MQQTNIYRRYSKHAFTWAFQQLCDAGEGSIRIYEDPEAIERMHRLCRQYESLQRPLPGLEPTPDRPTIPAPASVSNEYTEASNNFWGALACVGSLRGLYLVADGRGGYTATIKVTLPCGKHVYRYGRLQHPSGIEDMLHHTVENDRWSPDRM